MRISIELVPRSREALVREAAVLEDRFPGIDTVNVPQQARFPLTSIEAVRALAGMFAHRIPHLRARDARPADMDRLADALRAAALDEVIVVAGDSTPESGAAERSTPTAFTQALKARAPQVRIYTAIDPYRHADHALARNLADKLAAGADGFFSQPLFDLDALDRLEAFVPVGVPVFWGFSPVISDGSRRYWENVNGVVFPRHFEASLDWNVAFARQALTRIAARGGNAYLMPIRMNAVHYVEPLEDLLAA